MTAQEALAELDRLGFRYRGEAGALLVIGEDVPEELAFAIRAHKAEILSLLGPEEREGRLPEMPELPDSPEMRAWERMSMDEIVAAFQAGRRADATLYPRQPCGRRHKPTEGRAA
jgi:hypothetical protein